MKELDAMRVTADKVYNDLVNKQDELAELQSPTKFFAQLHTETSMRTLDVFFGGALDEMSFDLRDKLESLIKKYVEAIQVDMKVNNAITRCRHTDCWFFKFSSIGGVWYFPTLARSCKAPKVEKPKQKKRRKSPEDGPRGASSSKAKPGKKSPKSGKKPKGKGKKARKSKA